MNAQVEMRVGMSLYWLTLVAVPPGYRATWRQHGADREVWTGGDAGDAIAAAKMLARKINSEMATVSS